MRLVPEPIPAPAGTDRRQLALRLAATIVLALLSALAWRGGARVEREQRALVARAAAAGVEPAALRAIEKAVAREADPADGRVAIARALLEGEVARPAAAEPAVAAPRLELARDLAREALERQPARAEASWILGAAISLVRARARDTRLFSLSQDWERPLRRAIELAPHDREPSRMLVGAYLDAWPALSPQRRAETRALLREALENRATFQRLIGPWLDISGSLAAAAELLPDRSWAWAPLVERAGRDHDWRSFVELDRRRERAQRVEVDSELATAEALLVTGQALAARTAFDEVLARLAPDASAAPAVERLLARRPAGPAAERAAQAAVAWLVWAEPLTLLGRPSLAPEALGRLASLAGGRLTPDRAAFVALTAGDLSQAELFERRSESLWSERWAPFLVLRAARAIERQAPAEARAALEQAHRDFRKRLAWRRLAREVGLASGEVGRERWEATDWIWSGGTARLELDPARAASGLRLAIEGVGPDGALLQAIVDGRALEPTLLAGGATAARVEVALSAQPHLLELRIRAGAVRPAPAVELVR